MKVLVVGNGGREHALVWKTVNDSSSPEVFCAPGNAGTASIATNIDIGAEDISALVDWARMNRPDLVIVGPEVPLCMGLTDLLEAEGIRVFGPSKAAAEMEGSKVFAKDIMAAAGVPTGRYKTFTDAEDAREYVRAEGVPIVIKADGLAAGKGVTVCSSIEQANAAISEAMEKNAFGNAGNILLIEECLQGEEASILALVDGEHILMLASSQDHKRAFENDKGPNTGGMGAYSPAPIVAETLWPVIREQIFDKVLAELKKRGITYKGVLYAGLMISDEGINVLEFNCRFGDPETQAVLARIDGDILPAFNACVDGNLTDDLISWKTDNSVCVVLASGGYPGAYEKGRIIYGLKDANSVDGAVVFHAGTKLEGEEVVTSGGRVLGVTALGADLRVAVDRAYEAVDKIEFDGVQYRKDIAAKALGSKQECRRMG